MSSGTAGLHLRLRLAGVGPGRRGDHVAVLVRRVGELLRSTRARRRSSRTSIARTLNIDPAAVEAAITERTRAIVAVDIFGYPCELDAAREIADRHGLALIEDACEALGAEYKGRTLGSHGHLAVFAFYPNKQMTTGEGGMVVDRLGGRVARCSRASRNQGRADSGGWLEHARLGYNYRLDRRRGGDRRRPAREARPFLELRLAAAARYAELLARRQRGRAAARRRRRSHALVVRLSRPARCGDRPRARDRGARRALGIQTSRYLPSIHLQSYMRERFGFAEGMLPGRPRRRAGVCSHCRFTRDHAGRPGARRRSARSRAVIDVRSLDATEPFVTKTAAPSASSAAFRPAARRRQSLAEATLVPGQATERHYHGESEEVYFILEGEGDMEIGGERGHVRPGDAVPIPPGTWHTLTNTGTALSACSARARRRIATRTRSSSRGSGIIGRG